MYEFGYWVWISIRIAEKMSMVSIPIDLSILTILYRILCELAWKCILHTTTVISTGDYSKQCALNRDVKHVHNPIFWRLQNILGQLFFWHAVSCIFRESEVGVDACNFITNHVPPTQQRLKFQLRWLFRKSSQRAWAKQSFGNSLSVCLSVCPLVHVLPDASWIGLECPYFSRTCANLAARVSMLIG